MSAKEKGRPCLAAGTPSHRQPEASPTSDARRQDTGAGPERATRAYTVLPSPNAERIAAIVTSYGKTVDVALVEAWIRLSHPTLDELSAEVFRRQVASAITCVQITPLKDSIELAASYGLVAMTEVQDIASPAHPASGEMPSGGAGAASAALVSTGSEVAPHPTPTPRRSFTAGLRRIVEVLDIAGAEHTPQNGRAIRWREAH